METAYRTVDLFGDGKRSFICDFAHNGKRYIVERRDINELHRRVAEIKDGKE